MTGREHALAFLRVRPIPSRTMMQKLVYLAMAEQDEPATFRPYFYGPYSAELQAEIDRLVAEGLIEEEAKRLEPWESSPFEPMWYSYKLTEQGRRLSEELPERLRRRAEEIVAAADDVDAFTPAALSMAAKLRHLRTITPDFGEEDVPGLAARLGWRMSLADARRGSRLLERLPRGPSLGD
jgi:uncharacterized protein